MPSERIPTADRPAEPERLDRERRRDMLLDVAAALATEGGVDAVAMDQVADRAGVSRPLVYKHFANREELLGALYRREAGRLHAELTARVSAATDVEGMFRALVQGALAAAGERRHVLAVLRTGGWSRGVRDEQRERDSRTTQAFVAAVVAERGVDRRAAVGSVSLLLALIDGVLGQWRADPTPQRAASLEASYMTVVRGTLRELAGR